MRILIVKKDIASEILNEEWYENVSNAVSYAMNNLSGNVNPEQLFDMIVEYNIRKKVHEYVVENGTKTLRRKLDWRNKTNNEAFVEFKDIVDTCDICKKFRSFTFYINFGKDSGKLQNLFLLWKELTNTYYKNIKIVSKQDGDVYKIVIRRFN